MAYKTGFDTEATGYLPATCTDFDTNRRARREKVWKSKQQQYLRNTNPSEAEVRIEHFDSLKVKFLKHPIWHGLHKSEPPQKNLKGFF